MGKKNKSQHPRGVPHGSRTQAEGRAYIEDIVRGNNGSSTVPLQSINPYTSTNDTSLPSNDNEYEDVIGPSASHVRMPGFFEKNKSGVMIGFLGTFALSLVSAGFYWCYSFNRELGALDEKAASIKDRIDKLEAIELKQIENEKEIAVMKEAQVWLRSKIDNMESKISDGNVQSGGNAITKGKD